MANAFDGLSLTAGASVSVTVPVTAPVSLRPFSVNKAIPLPLPTLVKGRET